MKQRIFVPLFAALIVLGVGAVDNARAEMMRVKNESLHVLKLADGKTASGDVTSTSGAWLIYPKKTLRPNETTFPTAYLPFGSHTLIGLFMKVVYYSEAHPSDNVSIARGAMFGRFKVAATGCLTATVKETLIGLRAVIKDQPECTSDSDLIG